MNRRKTLKFLLCCGILGSVCASSTYVHDEGAIIAINNDLGSAVEKYGVRDVSEVLKLPEYFVNRFLYEGVPYDCIIKALKDFENKNNIHLEEFLAQQYEIIQIVSPTKNVDRDWEEKFQTAAKSQLLLPQEFKNPITINQYLSFLRGIDPLCEPYLHERLCLYSVSFPANVINAADNYRVYEAIRDYYRAGGAPLSVLLAIKVAEEKKKKEAEEWHLPWPFGNRTSSTASSAPSSNEGTPPNRSFGSTTPDGKPGERQPLLSEAEQHRPDGLRRRHVA
ncbi:MAG TPA: hypothetical protein DIC42_02810 [Holosporales bacterium]|nr:hypothetical protein [Holosporales bacterium]